MKPFTATARLQFHKDFTLDAAAALVPYFASLGISHLYASPLLKSRPGSTHGYDIVDHNQIDPELGSEEALHRLVAELRRHDMGLVLDIVPNHMGVGGADNEWWLDVLEWGRASAYAEYFDIDWDPPNASLRGRMLAPFLGSPYGDCLANKELTLQFDAGDGRFFVGYYTHRFPINPRDYPSILLPRRRVRTSHHGRVYDRLVFVHNEGSDIDAGGLGAGQFFKKARCQASIVAFRQHRRCLSIAQLSFHATAKKPKLIGVLEENPIGR